MTTFLGTTITDVWTSQLVAQPGVYAALHHLVPNTSDPLVSEISGGAYVRCPAVLSKETPRRVTVSNTLTWANLPSTNVVALVLYDAAVNGHLLIGATFTVPRVVPEGRSMVLPPGEVVFEF